MDFYYDWRWTRWSFGFDYMRSQAAFILCLGPLELQWWKKLDIFTVEIPCEIHERNVEDFESFKKAYGK